MLEIQDLKGHISLRDLIRTHWGQPHRSTRQYDVYFSRWREDGQRPSFIVYDEYFKDFGGEGISGDIFSFIQQEYRLNFAEALNWLQGYVGMDATVTKRPKSDHTYTLMGEAPPKTWQNIAQETLIKTQHILWSDLPEARLALDYLRQQRGLHDESIRAAGYGYNPSWMKTNWKNPDTGRCAYLAPGIIEPWFYDGHLWSLRVRCRVGSLAQALRIEPDQMDDRPSPKYLNLAGSRQSGALYNGDAIQPDQKLLLVEGGFDAILANQCLEDTVAITLGSVSNRPTDAQLVAMQSAKEIILLLDQDEAGQRAQNHLLDVLGQSVRIATLPQGKDITEFIVEHQGDLQAVMDAAQASAWWTSGLPDSVRTALLTYFRPSTAPVIELINLAAMKRLLNPACFTAKDVLAANEELGFDIPENTIRAILLELTDHFFQQIDPLTDPNDDSNAQKKGRPTILYCCEPQAAIKQCILAWAMPRIYEAYHPTEGEDAVVVNPTPKMLYSLGFSPEESQILARALEDAFYLAFQNQENIQKWTSKRALNVYQSLLESLDDDYSTPMPEKWPLNNVTNYRAAYLRATNDHTQRRSRRSIQELLGVANGTVGKMLLLAGLERTHEEGEYEYGMLNTSYPLELQINKLARKLKGYPRAIIVQDKSGDTVAEASYRGTESQVYVTQKLEQGYRVWIKFQVANHYVECVTDPADIEVPARRSSNFVPSFVPDSVYTKRPRFYGIGYDPEWIRQQLQLALFRSGRLQIVCPSTLEEQFLEEQFLDVLTGETFAHLTITQLLNMHLPHYKRLGAAYYRKRTSDSLR